MSMKQEYRPTRIPVDACVRYRRLEMGRSDLRPATSQQAQKKAEAA